MQILPLLAMLGIVAITVIGDWFLKHASLQTGWSATGALAGGMAMYMISALGFVVAMRHMSLAAVGAWYAMLTIMAMTALGVLVFGERLTPREALGLLLALAALILMSNRA